MGDQFGRGQLGTSPGDNSSLRLQPQNYMSKALQAQLYARQVAKRSGLPLYVVDRYDRTGIYRPSIRKGSGSRRHHPRLYSLEDVFALSIAKRLRALGLPARRIGRVLAAVRSRALLQPRYLLTDGKSVFFEDDTGAVVDMLREHQAAFALFLDPLYPKR